MLLFKRTSTKEEAVMRVVPSSEGLSTRSKFLTVSSAHQRFHIVDIKIGPANLLPFSLTQSLQFTIDFEKYS